MTGGVCADGVYGDGRDMWWREGGSVVMGSAVTGGGLR